MQRGNSEQEKVHSHPAVTLEESANTTVIWTKVERDRCCLHGGRGKNWAQRKPKLRTVSPRPCLHRGRAGVFGKSVGMGWVIRNRGQASGRARAGGANTDNYVRPSLSKRRGAAPKQTAKWRRRINTCELRPMQPLPPGWRHQPRSSHEGSLPSSSHFSLLSVSGPLRADARPRGAQGGSLRLTAPAKEEFGAHARLLISQIVWCPLVSGRPFVDYSGHRRLSRLSPRFHLHARCLLSVFTSIIMQFCICASLQKGCL